MARLFEVRLHEQPIGRLREADTGYVEFRFNDAYLRGKPPRPVLGQHFIDAPEKPQVGKQREELRFSLAGVRLKFSVVRAADKIAFPVTGERGDWIAKLDSHRFPGLVDNEYSVLEWARLAGFDVPACDLLPTTALRGSLMKYAEPNVSALAIRRYDRVDGIRVHQEDFAQVLNVRPQNKYANVTYEALASLVIGVVGEDGETGADEFLRRLVFVVASGNSDRPDRGPARTLAANARARPQPVRQALLSPTENRPRAIRSPSRG
jgi:hypothetical protein